MRLFLAVAYDLIFAVVIYAEVQIPDDLASNCSARAGDCRLLFADPFVMSAGGSYYAYGTHATNGIAVASSQDLLHWKLGVGRAKDALALHEKDSFGGKAFWAPEVHRRKDGKYVLFYTAEMQVCTAVSDSPLGPFVQPVQKPLFRVGHRKTIDSTLAYGENGRPVMFYVEIIPPREEIWSVAMSEDLLSVLPGTEKRILVPTEPWECIGGPIVEGPSIIKEGDLWYLLYSGSACRSHDYAVGFATASDLSGPWSKPTHDSPFLHRINGLVGTGHGTPFKGLDGHWHYVFHAHSSRTEYKPRCMNIVPIDFYDGEMKRGSVRCRNEVIACMKDSNCKTP